MTHALTLLTLFVCGATSASAQSDPSTGVVTPRQPILYGHSHKAEIKILNGKLYLNPGHLKATQDKGTPPSSGLLDIDYGTLQAAICQVNGKIVSSMTLKKSETGLYKI